MSTLWNYIARRHLTSSDILGRNNRFTTSFDYHSLQLTKSVNKFKDDFKMYFLTDADNLDEDYKNNTANVFLVNQLLEGALMVLTRDRKLMICDFKSGTVLEERTYPDKIISVKMNRTRLTAFLENTIYIMDIRLSKNIHTIALKSCCISESLCDMTMSDDNCLVAFPFEINRGGTTTVHIFDALNLKRKLEFCPYELVPLRAMVFNPKGNQLITASCEGTTIDIYSTNDGAKLFTFCRGMLNRVISNISVSDCGTYVACSSQSTTIHIFKLEEKPDSSRSVFGYLMYYMPGIVKQHIDGPVRAHAWIRLPIENVDSIVSIIKYKTKHIVVVTTSDGVVYVYNLDVEKGGRLRLQKGWRLDKIEENESMTDELHQAGLNLLREQNSGRPVFLEKLLTLKLAED